MVIIFLLLFFYFQIKKGESIREKKCFEKSEDYENLPVCRLGSDGIQNFLFYKNKNLFKIFYAICLVFRGEIMEFKPLALFGFFSVVNYITYKGIDHALALGLSIESYEYFNF